MTRLRRRLAAEQGLTLIEVLVSIGLFAIVTSVLLSVTLNSANNLKTVRQTTDLNEESRLVLNRMSREIREATGIIDVTNPDGTGFDPDADVSVRIQVDFNGDGVITQGGNDPEDLIYKYVEDEKRIVVIAPPDTTALPILAGNVEFFRFSYRSSDSRCDINSNGEVTWQEVEIAPNPCPEAAGDLVGGISALDVERSSIDSIVIEMTVLTGTRQQEYRTTIDLRNKI